MDRLRDIWAIGPTAAALALRSQGFSPGQADRLVRLRIRRERGEFRELTAAQRRRLHLGFLRYLADHGRFDDGELARANHDRRSLR